VLACLLLATVAATAASAQSVNTGTTLRGYVGDTEGKPVPYAYVFERTAQRFVVSDADGWFVLALPIQRAQAIGTRRIGYHPLETQLSQGDREKLLRLVLTPGAPATRPSGKPGGYDESLDRTGFYRRMALASNATFMTVEQIERRSSRETASLLDNVAGIDVISRGATPARSSIARSGSGCTLGVVIDGRRAEDETLPAAVSGALEIYPSAAAVPEEFRHHAKGCGLVLIWGG